MPVIGTAGHVDHGKSTLVRALTGRDPDRWEEEKRRGLTIDLGFAWTTFDDGLEVGFVDVPGHERFIKNMLAGIDAIDVALFVVAADEGWMPQSEEHLAVLDLLGVRGGVIALTRADLVDDELLELAELTVREQLEETVLADAPIVPTAAPEGRGLDEIRRELAAALAAAPARGGDRPRLWVDRAFTIEGAGTVVTGTLLDGSIGLGDSLALWPGQHPVRVRGLHSHERSRDRILPGNRSAINLVGIDLTVATRGAMVGHPDQWRPTGRFVADLRTVRGLAEPLRDRGAFHLHIGSCAWPARLRLLEGRTLQGAGAALVEFDAALPLKVRDRFILREVGRRVVVAGGTILDPNPARRSRQIRPSLSALRGAGPDVDSIAQALLGVRARGRIAHLTVDSGGGKVPENAIVAAGEALDSRAASELTGKALALVGRYHADSPLRPGMPRASLAERLGLSLALLEPFLAAAEGLVDDGTVVRSAAFTGELSEGDQSAWQQARNALDEGGAAAPRIKDLPIGTELLHALIRSGRLIRVGPDFAYLPVQLDTVVERVRRLGSGFTVGEFKGALGITRKHAVPLLEWLDAAGITRRDGDVRLITPT